MSTAPQFDTDLLKRYDRPGPRYTSYPTAPQFTAAVGEAQLREQARRSNEKAVPRPLHPLVADGLATVVGDYICATPRGRLLLRVIAMCFDRYLQAPDATEARQRFSKVV